MPRPDPPPHHSDREDILEPVFPRWTPPVASAATPAGMLALGGTSATIFRQRAPPAPTPSRREPTAQDPSLSFSPSTLHARPTADTRRGPSSRYVSHREPHPEAAASRNRPIRSRSAANSCRGTATSANWNTRYFACDTTLAPILTSFSRRVVRFQPRINRGSANCRSAFAKLYAKANNCKRAALSWNRRHDSLVHFTAFLPSLL